MFSEGTRYSVELVGSLFSCRDFCIVITNWIRIPACEGISPFVVASGPAHEDCQCVLFTRGIKRTDREAEQSPAFLVVEKSRYCLTLPYDSFVAAASPSVAAYISETRNKGKV